MAKCIRIDDKSKQITGKNAQIYNEHNKLISKNCWFGNTWTGRTDNYYIISDDSIIEGL